MRSFPLHGLVALLIATAGCGGGGGEQGPVDAATGDLMKFTPRPDLTPIPGTCEDGRINQDETDADCGGHTCLPCTAGKMCKSHEDCLGAMCLGGRCGGSVNCSDGVQNGFETDVDCGGPDCAGCNSGGNCASDSDCLSRHCTALRCASCALAFDPHAEFAVGPQPRALAAADLDGDGKADIITANNGMNDGDTISVLRGNGKGGFGAKMDFTVGRGPHALALADLDGDGRLDVVVANAAASTVSVRKNLGNGIFGNHQELAVDGALGVAVADLDDDKRLDLIVATGNAIAVLRNIGGMRFSAATNHPAGDQPVAVAAGDIDGDGKPDLAVANESSGAVGVLLTSGGMPGVRTGIATGLGPRSLALVDVDGDSRRDIVAVNEGAQTMTVLINAGGGKFAPKPKSFPTGASSLGTVALIDLDADTRPDLVLGDRDGMRVLVFIAQGGTFPSSTAFPTGAGPMHAAGADFDGDGRTDLAVANYGSGDSVSILLNRCK